MIGTEPASNDSNNLKELLPLPLGQKVNFDKLTSFKKSFILSTLSFSFKCHMVSFEVSLKK